jgi:hypothetical protein
VNEIYVTDGGNDQGFESGRGEALDDAGGEEVVVIDLGLAKGSPNDYEERRNEEDRSLAIFPCESADYTMLDLCKSTSEALTERSDAASREQIVARCQHNRSYGSVQLLR